VIRAVAIAAVVLVSAGCASGGSPSSPPTSDPSSSTPPPPAPQALVVHGGSVALDMRASVRTRLGRGGEMRRRAAAVQYLDSHTSIGGGRWIVRLMWRPTAASRLAAAVADPRVRSVTLPVGVSEVSLTVPATRQVYRNDCEATALSMALGGSVSQLRLQSQLPIAHPYLPEEGAEGMVWGDPELGFVGNVRGGGYGVYDRPVLALARRYDRGAENLTGTSVDRVVAAVQQGRPVVAWIQFGADAPRTWRSPAGVLVQANGAEHAVTLTGWRPGVLTYNNPWTGTRESFTVATFAQLWHTLGDRAVAVSSLIGKV
jgi:uncharacterized protein YvpB